MIRVNDKWEIQWQAGITIQEILEACKFTHQHIVVSVDGNLVPPEDYITHKVRDGAKIRVIHVIGGG